MSKNTIIFLGIAITVAALFIYLPAREEPAPKLMVRPRQLQDGMLAVCITASREYDDVMAGTNSKDKNPMTLTQQSAIGEKAHAAGIEEALRQYKAGVWNESLCKGLSKPIWGGWAQQDGYLGDSISVPDGAIGKVFDAEGWGAF